MDTHLNPALAGAGASGAAATFPAYRLFDAGSVFIAAILGSPVAGVALMGLNYRRLGEGRKGLVAFIIGVVATALVCVIGYFLPSSGSVAVGVVLAAATRGAAQRWQGAAVAQHQARGGELSSRWAATGIGLGFLVLFCVVIVAGALGLGGEHRAVIGTKDEVYFVGAATKADALGLGEALKKDGYFQDHGVTVILTKDADGTSISFVVKDGIWDDASMVAGYQALGRQLGPVVGGFPIKVRLVNGLKQTKKEIDLTE
jgi:hypothetical protein